MRMTLMALVVAAIAAPGAAKDRNQFPEAEPAGKPQSCIRTSQIRQTHVRNDWVIDFEMIGGKFYRNTLPMSCASLTFEQRFAYRTSMGQLCSTDTITVLQQGASNAGPSCGLGEFQPVRLVKKP